MRLWIYFVGVWIYMSMYLHIYSPYQSGVMVRGPAYVALALGSISARGIGSLLRPCQNFFNLRKSPMKTTRLGHPHVNCVFNTSRVSRVSHSTCHWCRTGRLPRSGREVATYLKLREGEFHRLAGPWRSLNHEWPERWERVWVENDNFCLMFHRDVARRFYCI
jgi:hypothetical protein